MNKNAIKILVENDRFIAGKGEEALSKCNCVGILDSQLVRGLNQTPG